MATRTERMGRAIVSVALLIGCIALGGLVGSLVLRLLLPPAADGWTGIADALGALMLGGLGGLVLGCGALFGLRGRPLWPALVVSWVLGLGSLIVLSALPNRGIALPDRPIPFEPAFVVQMYSAIAPGEPGPSPDAEGFPYRELRVSAVSRELTAKGWGYPPSVCYGTPNEADLAELAELAQVLYEANPASCPGEGPGYRLTVEWPGSPTRGANVAPRCFSERPALAAFLEGFDRVRARLDGTGDCD